MKRKHISKPRVCGMSVHEDSFSEHTKTAVSPQSVILCTKNNAKAEETREKPQRLSDGCCNKQVKVEGYVRLLLVIHTAERQG